MIIKVRTVSGDKPFQVEVPNDASVRTLKQLIESKSGVGLTQQRLIFSGKVLRDEKHLTEYGECVGAGWPGCG